MKEDLINFLKQNIEYELDFEKLLEKPKHESHGDFALPMFLLAKELKSAPPQIAKDYEEKLNNNLPNFLEKVVAVGPFLNFYLNSSLEAKNTIESIEDGSIFDVENEVPQKILIEYPSPNTNKNLHIGHLRNMLLGNSLGKILRYGKNNVVRTNLNNDRGIAICKSMLGYQEFYSDETPESLVMKPDEFVSMCYVRFENEAQNDDSLNVRAQQMLVDWEAGKDDVISLWKKILSWVMEGYNRSYENFKLEVFDREYFESDIYDKGKDIVLKALEDKVNGFAKEDDGAVYVDLEDKGYGKKYLLRGDGTTLYMTQDIYLASLKEEDFGCDKYVFIVGKEQEYHFKVLFEILERLGFEGTKKNYHFAYGYVYDKDGKKFSSRKGKTIGADWLLSEVVAAAKNNLLTKELTKDLDDIELDRRASIIGYGALAFSILKVNPLDDIKFDIEKATSFEGETGPYVQYTFARINSLLKKSGVSVTIDDIDYDSLEEKEINLIKTLKDFNAVAKEAIDKYRPSAIANYLIKVCQAFNEFYQNCPILKEEENVMKSRLVLSDMTSKVIREGLMLLDIETLDEM